MTTSSANQATPTTHPSSSPVSVSHISRLAYPPIVHVVWGLFLLVVFVFGTMLQVQTNEAWMLHSENPSMWAPNLNLFLQFPQFWNGHMDAKHTVAFLFAWGVQVIMITCKIGLARVQVAVVKKYGQHLSHEDIAKAARRRGWVWDVCSGLIVLGNSVTDFFYASSLGLLQQIAFTVVLFLTTFFSGTHGIQHIAVGIEDMRKSH